MNVDHLIYEDIPRYDLWFKLIIGGTLALTLVLGLALLSTDLQGAWIALGVTVFDALLFNAIIPRRYQIFQDKLRIVLGRPFAFNIPLVVISRVRPASSWQAFAGLGIRLATSSKGVVEITRHKGQNIVISPSDQELFLEHAAQALKSISNS